MSQYSEQMSQQNPSKHPAYGAIGGNEAFYSQIGTTESSNLPSYGTVPNRAVIYSSPGHVPRSSSHDQLSRYQAYQAKPSYFGYHSPPGMTSSPSTQLYSTPSTMYHSQQTQPMVSQVQVPPSASPQRAPGRPMPVYSSWSSQPNIIQPQDQSINVHENETSPVTSSGSSNDSLPVVIPSPSPSPSVSSTLYSNTGMNGGRLNPGFVMGTGRKVRALYNCVGENSTELSFEPNAIIFNGKSSSFIASLFSSLFLPLSAPFVSSSEIKRTWMARGLLQWKDRTHS